MIRHAKKFDKWLHSHLIVLLALLMLIILRVPNFFEPYWYGDEGIYLTVGNALRNGERLYTDIVDHKTPLIYYLAAVPSQLDFRFLTLVWMIVTTLAFYEISKKLFNKNLGAVAVSTFVFVFLTSVPWLEGNIPNGELFVMGFVLVGGWILTHTKLFDVFLSKKSSLEKVTDLPKLYLVGFLFGLGVMTKVPGILDAVAWLTLLWFILARNSHLFISKRKEWLDLLKKVSIYALVLLAGLLTPLLISIIYYTALGSGPDYLQFGLLYNFHYAGNWSLPFQNPLLKFFFTLPGKILVAAFIYLILTFKDKKFTAASQLIFGWFTLSLVGALLSNRPYPHYYQQVVPAFSLLLGNLLVTFIKNFHQKKKKIIFKVLPITVMSIFLLFLAGSALKLLNFGAYEMVSYYKRFAYLISGRMSPEEYRDSFNYLMKDNYDAAKIIKKSGTKEIFIWGTNPMLYALSGTNPTGRFTVSFHIKDLGVYQETMEGVRHKKPLFIVVMDDENDELEGLEEYLQQHYVINSNFTHFRLWKRRSKEITHLVL